MNEQEMLSGGYAHQAYGTALAPQSRGISEVIEATR